MSNFQWPPLESDPQIFTEYSNKLGLVNASFEELLSLDYKEIQFIESPVLAVIVNCERKAPLAVEASSIKNFNYVPFYMKQTDILDNACGVIALLHSLGNNQENVQLVSDSCLDKFFKSTSGLNDLERAKFLESFDEFKTMHTEYSAQGQSSHCETQSDVKCHYVAFVCIGGNLVELDGTIDGPKLIKEGIKNEDLLDETIAEIKMRLSNGNITENLALMFLALN